MSINSSIMPVSTKKDINERISNKFGNTMPKWLTYWM